MTIADAIRAAVAPALALLPEAMDTLPARAMLVAIALQESELEHRRQVNGPARGFWQFELGGGVRGVLAHAQTERLARQTCERLNYPPHLDVVHAAIEHNDVLAAVFARLLLWTLPGRLPGGPVETEASYGQYIDGWRPGKPKPGRWPSRYHRAWQAVTA